MTDMSELKIYQTVNQCQSLRELAGVIRMMADENGMIRISGDRQSSAELMANQCENFNPGTNANYLTRRYGIRQQAYYLYNAENPPLEEYLRMIEVWASLRGIGGLKETAAEQWPQYQKMLEETQEIGTAIINADQEEKKDGVGDQFVTAVIFCLQNGINFRDCVDMAWNAIKNRTGKTVNGVFIKDSEK